MDAMENGDRYPGGKKQSTQIKKSKSEEKRFNDFVRVSVATAVAAVAAVMRIWCDASQLSPCASFAIQFIK